jgi:hypothetical protein
LAGKEDGTYAYPAGQPGGGSVNLRKQIRILRDFMDSIPFAKLKPRPDILLSDVAEGHIGIDAWAARAARSRCIYTAAAP